MISLCTEAGFSPQIGTTASNAVGVLALVEAGEGVAILARGQIILNRKELVLVPLVRRALVAGGTQQILVGCDAIRGWPINIPSAVQHDVGAI